MKVQPHLRHVKYPIVPVFQNSETGMSLSSLFSCAAVLDPDVTTVYKLPSVFLQALNRLALYRELESFLSSFCMPWMSGKTIQN